MNEVAKVEPENSRLPAQVPSGPAAEAVAMFELQQRRAKAYSLSTLVPKDYQNNPANVIIAMNIAERLGADELMVMQNLHIIHGKPGWSGQFLIACLNQCGKFGTIEYATECNSDGKMVSCKAIAIDARSGKEIEGPAVTWEMAVKEGWTKKSGSKWMTMPDLMFRYRAAAFFVRTVCPEIALGLPLADENRDEVASEPPSVAKGIAGLEEQIKAKETAPITRPATSESTVESPVLEPDPPQVSICDACIDGQIETEPGVFEDCPACGGSGEIIR